MIIRAAKYIDLEKIARIQLETWKSTYANIIPATYLSSLSIHNCEKNLYSVIKTKQQFCLVCDMGDNDICGFVIAGKQRDENLNYDGEIYAIYVKSTFQRKGIGSLLIRSAMNKLFNHNFNHVLVWVLVKNPYKAFYEKLGGTCCAEKYVEIDNVRLKEVAYMFLAEKNGYEQPLV